MSKGLKRSLIIAVAIIAIVALSTSVAYAFWNDTSKQLELTPASVASNVKLTATTGDGADKTKALAPSDAVFVNANIKKQLQIASFTPTLSSDLKGVTDASLAERVKLTYTVTSIKVNNVDNTNLEVIVSPNTDATSPVAASTGVLTNKTKYYVFIKFKANVSDATTAQALDGKAIKVSIQLNAANK